MGCHVANKADNAITHNSLFKILHHIEHQQIQLPEVIIWVHVVKSKNQVNQRLPAEGTVTWLV